MQKISILYKALFLLIKEPFIINLKLIIVNYMKSIFFSITEKYSY